MGLSNSLENLHPEIVDLRLDVSKLQEHFHKHVLSVKPTMQTPAFGGWSVWSSTGEVSDGWGQGHLSFSENRGRVRTDFVKMASEGLVSTEYYNRPTSICSGYLKEVMEQIEERGLNPRRARITMVPPSGSTDMHRDGAPEFYSVRLHVPIITNPDCFFEYENGPKFHMKSDGSGLLVRVNQRHRACNLGESPRYHLIMDVFDFSGVTTAHRWNPGTEVLRGWPSKTEKKDR